MAIKKSLYHKNGRQLTEKGTIVSKRMSNAIRKIYCEWIDKGYSKKECRKMFLKQVVNVANYQDSIRP